MLPKATLVRELDEEIKLRVEENDFSKYPISICWDTSTPKSAQHLGLIYEYKIPNKTPKQILDKREFWESPEKSLFTFYQPISQDLAVIEDMESWSISILQTEYHINFEPKLAQNTLL
jgi:hypothetical protein